MNEPLINKFKVLVIGNTCAGKTSILIRHATGRYDIDVKNTVGIDYRSIIYNKYGKKYNLQIWDTAGQERFNNVTRAYYRDADAALLVFDLNNPESFLAIKQWYHDLLLYSDREPHQMVIILVGNKSDLEHKVSLTEIQSLATELGISSYIQTSVKNGEHIGEVFDRLLDRLIHSVKSVPVSGVVLLSEPGARTRSLGRCCTR